MIHYQINSTKHKVKTEIKLNVFISKKDSLWKVIGSTSFRWRKTGNDKKLLIEKKLTENRVISLFTCIRHPSTYITRKDITYSGYCLCIVKITCHNP
jgi:hypothetical protein